MGLHGGNITGPWYRAHRIFREIRDEIAAVLRESGVTPDNFPLNHVAYCNYFLRPAPVAGERRTTSTGSSRIASRSRSRCSTGAADLGACRFFAHLPGSAGTRVA